MCKKKILGVTGILLLMASLVCLGGNPFDKKGCNKKEKVTFAFGEERMINVVEQGQWTTGPDGHTKVRGRITQYQETMQGPAAALVSGVVTTSMNCNLDENMTGQCWGSYEWPISAAEKWVGAWEGNFNFGLVVGSYHAFGAGEGGRLAGLRLEYDCVYPAYPQPALNFAKIVDRD